MASSLLLHEQRRICLGLQAQSFTHKRGVDRIQDCFDKIACLLFLDCLMPEIILDLGVTHSINIANARIPPELYTYLAKFNDRAYRR